MADLASKLPLKRLESPIQKFTKVAVPTDLQRLQQHQHNIEKFQRLQQWDRLHQEHVNASRTVQQLRSNLREMEKLCGRVHDDDVEALQKLVQPIREQAVAATRDFLRLHAEAVGRAIHTHTHTHTPHTQPLSKSSMTPPTSTLNLALLLLEI
uniref:STX17-like N-terminal domain-containing protein n=1 Tax=Denticeps clupeoides TaxID=299321 RepID=A0AAY4DTT9_9TELE